VSWQHHREELHASYYQSLLSQVRDMVDAL
ncbi:hypothetical protein NZA43_24505, partial [Escherichia coli]|nr:hypothetical protein [Escherichia coli]